jgi:hypothetical protein
MKEQENKKKQENKVEFIKHTYTLHQFETVADNYISSRLTVN